MLNQLALDELKARFSEYFTSAQFDELVELTKDEYQFNSQTFITEFEAIHNTNVTIRRHLEVRVGTTFAYTHAKTISQAIIAATGVDVTKAYQDSRNQKADRIEKALVDDYQWSNVNGVLTYSEEGNLFHLKWSEDKSALDVILDGESVFNLKVAGYYFNTVAERIDSSVYDAV